ncbi:MAG: hypothetical protein H6797_02515 [Candidatus Nomurabacteria bacterium]|nr:MAG: hypothetical protein H6797_02515 [Candidatus Nomurabacteria bacterium]
MAWWIILPAIIIVGLIYAYSLIAPLRVTKGNPTGILDEPSDTPNNDETY